MRRRILSVVLIVAATAAGWLANFSREEREGNRTEVGDRRVDTAAAAFAARRSGVWIEDSGRVEALLDDDREGSRHQRFIVELGNGKTILISHNIDLAPRVPIRKGDEVTIRGEYVWNERGGLVHWTHSDPKGVIQGGWIEHQGEIYR